MSKSKRFERFHHYFFTWHCRNFFNFGQHLSALEWKYLQTCFRLAGVEEDHDWGGGPHYSYYTYSHRVRGRAVNSSRLAYGAVARWQGVAGLAQEIIAERGLELEPYFTDSENSAFYLLGWDFQEEHFKVYFRITDLAALPQPELRRLLEKCQSERHRQGLVSFTFVGGQVAEKKVYVYLTGQDLPDGAYAVAHMITDVRGLVPQYDVTGDWRGRLNSTGQEILQRYQALRQPLDTIAYQDPENFTLYFPPRSS